MIIMYPLLLMLPLAISGRLLSQEHTFSNCTGKEASPPLNLAADTLPHLSSGENSGWEEWELMTSLGVAEHAGEDAPGFAVAIFRWTRGNSDSIFSDPSKANFSADVYFTNGTIFHASDSGSLTVDDRPTFKEIAIGENRLRWADDLSRYNMSINAQGLLANLSADPLPSFPFTPFADGIKGKIADDLYTDVIVPRGHIDGPLTWPWGDSLVVASIGSMQHSYSLRPLRASVKSLTRGVIWSGSTEAVFNINWFNVETVDRKRVQAVQLTKSIPEAIIYEATNDPSVFTMHTHGPVTWIHLAGCDSTNGLPYAFAAKRSSSIGHVNRPFGSRVSYYNLNITGVVPVNGSAYNLPYTFGFLEEYQSRLD